MLEPGILLLLLLFLLHRSPFSGHFVTDFQQTKNNRGRSLRVRAGRHGGESGPTGDPRTQRDAFRVLETGKLKREEKKQPAEESGEKADGASRG